MFCIANFWWKINVDPKGELYFILILIRDLIAIGIKDGFYCKSVIEVVSSGYPYKIFILYEAWILKLICSLPQYVLLGEFGCRLAILGNFFFTYLLFWSCTASALLMFIVPKMKLMWMILTCIDKNVVTLFLTAFWVSCFFFLSSFCDYLFFLV